MRVVIEQGVYAGGMRGIHNYAMNLAKSLAKVAPEHEFILFGFFFRKFEEKAAQVHCPDAPNFKLALKRWPESLVVKAEWGWNLPLIDAFCRGEKADLYHAPGTRLPHLSKTRGVLTLHDMVWAVHPEFMPPEVRGSLPAFVYKQLDRARLILVDSDCTARDLLERRPEYEPKLRRVYLGIDHEAFAPLKDEEKRAALRAKFKLKERFLISAGPWEPRRNLETELKALRILLSRKDTADCGLVLTGQAEGAYCDGLRKQVQALGLRTGVLWTGHVTPEELTGLYSLSSGFVYPSWYDGYNMPMLEAMSCGAPVAVSKVGALPELGADACLYFPPGDEQAMAESMRQLLTNPTLVDYLRKKGFERTADFQWDKTALETLAVYLEAAS